MAFDLPHLPIDFTPEQLQIWWQQMRDALVTQEQQQDELLEQVRLNVMRLRIGLSYTSPSNVLTAADVGSDATITVASHTRVYGDGSQLAITGGDIAGLAFSTEYVVYYDDDTLSDTTPVFQATITILNGQMNFVDGRHFVGQITTPADGGGSTGGGNRPPGGGLLG